MRQIGRIGFPLVAVFLIAEGVLYAQTVTGTLDASDSTMPVVFISTPNCTGQGTSPVHYEVIPFVVNTSGNYTLSLTSPGNFASFYLYEVAFDPANGITNCIAGANSGTPKQVTEALTANVAYVAVPFDDSLAQAGGTYSLAFSGPAQAHATTGWVVTGPGAGAGPHVRVVDGPDAVSARDFFAYDSGFSGGVRVALADVNNDRIPDTVTGAGPGGTPLVRVFDGVTGAMIRSFLAYDPGFTGGVFVAAGDVNGDGRPDIITGAGAGAGPQVNVFDGVTGATIRSFFAYDPTFTGGVRVAAGDVNGDGRADILTGTENGASHVVVYEAVTGLAIHSFIAYAGSTGGVSVAAGDVNGDGKADIFTGAGPGSGPHVYVLDGVTRSVIWSFFAYNPAFAGGVSVAAGDVNNDGVADIITGAGPGGGPEVKIFSGATIAVLKSFFPYDPAFSGGVFVASVPIPRPRSAGPQVYRGTIGSGAQFDLFSIPLLAGTGVFGRLVCEVTGGTRPLDPVLSVFFPGGDPTDTTNANVFNDDGFGADDNPLEGVDCDAFDSSQAIFTAPVTGVYTFRADGFGSSTGPYSLTIVTKSLVTGADAGAGPHVQAFAGAGGNPNAVTRSFFAYDPGFTAGVRVAVDDVTGDGAPDIITGTGAGGGPHVRVIDGVFGNERRGFFAYDPAFTGGVFVAAGDVNGDGRADIISGTNLGAPHVRVFEAVTGAELFSFFAYDPGLFAAGVRVAAGDIDGDGKADIITAPGAGGDSQIRVFSGADGSLLTTFAAYPGFTGGVYVASADVNADGRADIITAPGPGGGPHIQVFSGADNSVLTNFFAYDLAFTGGVRVAAADLTGDGRAEIITSPGPGGGPHVKVFSNTGTELRNFFAYDPGFVGGVFVGGR